MLHYRLSSCSDEGLTLETSVKPSKSVLIHNTQMFEYTFLCSCWCTTALQFDSNENQCSGGCFKSLHFVTLKFELSRIKWENLPRASGSSSPPIICAEIVKPSSSIVRVVEGKITVKCINPGEIDFGSSYRESTENSKSIKKMATLCSHNLTGKQEREFGRIRKFMWTRVGYRREIT